MQDDHLSRLIGRCALRDQNALKMLYQGMGPYLNRVAFKMLRSEDQSNDVLQEAFIQIWHNASSYQASKGRPKAWLTSIVRYRALDRLAKEKRHSEQRLQPTDDYDPLSEIASTQRPDELVEEHQNERTLANCLEQLNEQTRESIKLAYLSGYSRDEIALRLRANVNTVKSWLRRGAERLKLCVEQKIEELV